MGLLKALLNTAVDVVALPLDLARDVVDPEFTEESNTERRLKKLGEDVDDVADDIF